MPSMKLTKESRWVHVVVLAVAVVVFLGAVVYPLTVAVVEWDLPQLEQPVP